MNKPYCEQAKAIKHDNRSRAKAAMKDARERGAEVGRVYQCEFCKKWHYKGSL